MDNARSFAIQKFAVDLLESIDNFDRALLAVPADKVSAPQTPENKDLLDLVAGLKMTQNVLMATMGKHGLERYDPSEQGENGKPQKFDPNLHEATFMIKNENLEDGDVMHTQSKGFILNGRVLRVSILFSLVGFIMDANVSFRQPRLVLSGTHNRLDSSYLISPISSISTCIIRALHLEKRIPKTMDMAWERHLSLDAYV